MNVRKWRIFCFISGYNIHHEGFGRRDDLQCPICGGKATGKVGVEQYYCWDCCVEYRLNKEGVQIYEVAEDGSLVAFDPHNEFLM